MELRLRNLSKTYPNGVRALHDASLTIPSGMFGLLGPNGAGKSTLMRTIATLQEPDSGRIEPGEPAGLRQQDAVHQVLDCPPPNRLRGSEHLRPPARSALTATATTT